MHPSEAILILYLEDKLSAEEREEMESHLSDCAHCAEQLEMIRKLSMWEDDASIPMPEPRTLRKAEQLVRSGRPFWNAQWYGIPRWGIAAVAVLVAAVGIAYFSAQAPVATRFRDSAPAMEHLTMIPADNARVEDPEPSFKWSGVENSVGYRMYLYDNSGSVLWSSSTGDTTMTLSPAIVLRAHTNYLWRVEIFFRDGSIHRSLVHVFTYAPVSP